MSIDQASPLVPIKPQVSLQNSAFIKNSHNRSSFCGVSPSSGTFKTFAVNRKSWSGNGTLPLQQFTPEVEQIPHLATFRSGTGTFPRNRERNNNATNGILTPNGNSVQSFKGNELRRSGCHNGRRYAEIGYWNKRWVRHFRVCFLMAFVWRLRHLERFTDCTSLVSVSGNYTPDSHCYKLFISIYFLIANGFFAVIKVLRLTDDWQTLPVRPVIVKKSRFFHLFAISLFFTSLVVYIISLMDMEIVSWHIT